jgi:hypothetical protein
MKTFSFYFGNEKSNILIPRIERNLRFFLILLAAIFFTTNLIFLPIFNQLLGDYKSLNESKFEYYGFTTRTNFELDNTYISLNKFRSDFEIFNSDNNRLGYFNELEYLMQLPGSKYTGTYISNDLIGLPFSLDMNQIAVSSELKRKYQINIGDLITFKFYNSNNETTMIFEVVNFFGPHIGMYDLDYTLLDRSLILLPFKPSLLETLEAKPYVDLITLSDKFELYTYTTNSAQYLSGTTITKDNLIGEIIWLAISSTFAFFLLVFLLLFINDHYLHKEINQNYHVLYNHGASTRTFINYYILDSFLKDLPFILVSFVSLIWLLVFDRISANVGIYFISIKILILILFRLVFFKRTLKYAKN